MGLFSKIKSMFHKQEEKEEEKLIETEISSDDEDLEEDEKFDDFSEESFEEDEKIEIKEDTKKEENKKEIKSEDTKKEKSSEPKNNSVKVYEKGLTKSRQGFVSKLANLTNKYNKVTDEYFDELEEILIMADIGVNTVMDFIDRLRDRVRS